MAGNNKPSLLAPAVTDALSTAFLHPANLRQQGEQKVFNSTFTCRRFAEDQT